MLAEPRRKIRYALDPQGTTWSKDKSKFGQKLLEKMGWSEGKGLGANENGMTDHIKLKLRQDNAGVGFTRKYDDNWLEHQDGFNDLLATLGTSAGPPRSKTADGLSLLEKSEQSRARVHYHKFVKGKDISQYSQVDLHSILGTKKIEKKKKKLEEDKEASEPSSRKENGGAEAWEQTFRSAVNMKDYFADKMEARRRSGEERREDEEMSRESAYAGMRTVAEEDASSESSTSLKKKKKKKSKREKYGAVEERSEEVWLQPEQWEDEVGGDLKQQEDGADEAPQKRRKSRKRKHSADDARKEENAESSVVGAVGNGVVVPEEGQPDPEDGDRKKKKKKKKEKETAMEVKIDVETEASPSGIAESSSKDVGQYFKGGNFQAIQGYSAFKVFTLDQERALYEEHSERKKKKVAVRQMEEENSFFS